MFFKIKVRALPYMAKVVSLESKTLQFKEISVIFKNNRKIIDGMMSLAGPISAFGC